MVDLIGFAGEKSFLGVWRSSIGDLTKDGGGVLLQKEINGFFCISRQTLASLESIIEGVAKKIMEQSSGAIGRFSWIFIFV